MGRPKAATSSTEGLLDFVPRINPRYSKPKHLQPLITELERSWTEEVRCTACAPPRHAKTETVLAFIVLTLLKHPEKTIGYVTHSDSLARSKSRKARAMALKAGVQLAKDAQTQNEWRTPQGGGLLALGLSGGLTGQGLDLLFIDDPYKNRLQAESKAHAKLLRDFMDDVGETRIEPGGSVFIFHTRWNTDDLIGYVHGGVADESEEEGAEKLGDDDERDAGYIHINMPALSVDEKTGEEKALWPERWPVATLKKKRARVHEFTWMSLYQGSPIPRGGRIFGAVQTCKLADVPAGLPTGMGLDLGYSGTSDWSVLVKMARRLLTQEEAARKGIELHDLSGKQKHVYYVTQIVRQREKAPVFAKRLALARGANPGVQMRWYCSGIEKGIADFYVDEGLPVNVQVTQKNKVTRCEAYAADWNEGLVIVPEDLDGADDFVTEHCAFTGQPGGTDDQVDAGTGAHDELDVAFIPAVPTGFNFGSGTSQWRI